MDNEMWERAFREMGEIRRLLTSAEKRRPLRMPDGIQRSVRQVIRKLQEDEENPLVINFEKFENNDVKTIVREVRRAYKDYDWGAGTVEEAVKRVWRNMRDENKRKENGKVKQHRDRNRAAKRKRDKLKSRLLQLEKDEFFTKEEKKTVRRSFSVESMSPEVTDDEDTTRRVAIPFIWESSKMTDIKRVLDADYRESLAAQSRRQKTKVFRSTTDVLRTPPPKDIPSWAISSTYVQE